MDSGANVEPKLAANMGPDQNPPKADGGPEQVLQNMAVLDLTGMKSPEDLAAVTKIRNVALILVPESLSPALMRIPMENVAATVAVPDGANVKMHTGQIKMTGEALENAGGDPEGVLLTTGQLFLTTPVKKVGYKQLIVTGQLLAPKGSETALGAGITRLTGEAIYYSGTPRFLTGEERIGKAFLELLDGPVTFIVSGQLTFEPDVTADLLKSKVTEIVLMGQIFAPRALLPLVQVLTEQKHGDIAALEDAKPGE